MLKYGSDGASIYPSAAHASKTARTLPPVLTVNTSRASGFTDSTPVTPAAPAPISQPESPPRPFIPKKHISRFKAVRLFKLRTILMTGGIARESVMMKRLHEKAIKAA